MEEKPATKRLVLVPVPAQGHISPMMQLAKTLHLKGFSITVVQTKFNYFTPSDDFTDFQFVTIPESLPETDFKNLGPIEFLLKLNKECQVSFKDLLGQLLLEAILSRNGQTEYLRGFLNGQLDKQSFKKNLPLVTYEDIKPYIDRIASGEPSDLICDRPISLLLATTGTSGGVPKLIPLTAEELEQRILFGFLYAPLAFKHIEGLSQGKSLMFYFVTRESETASGLMVRFMITCVLKSVNPTNSFIWDRVQISPHTISTCEDTNQGMYCQLLCGLLQRENVARLGAPYASSFLKVIKFLEDHWPELCSNIRTGLLSDWITDAQCASGIGKFLTAPNPELASLIEKVCSKTSWEAILRRLWPKAKCIEAVVTGTMAQYIPLLEFYGGGLPLISSWYGSSECFIGINLNPLSKPCDVSYTIIPSMGYFEFIEVVKDPQESGHDPAENPVVIDLVDVKIGHDYELVVTTFSEPKRQQEELVPEFHPLRYKDFPVSRFASLDGIMEVYKNTVDKRTASSVIINTASCLESSSLSFLQQQLEIQVYPIGPLHMVASAPTSLLEENKSCIKWLNKQKVNSVIYISLGSVALMEINEVMEMAWGLAASNQHFLWVIRPGSIRGSEWTESLSEEFSKMVSDQGYIVKWAPQKEVLAHPAIGGFWSHCGWNSTLESIGEGIPMICRPFSGDQKVNARYLECVWRIGTQVEGELDRGVVERAVKKLMVDEEGEEMRKRAVSLKEKLRASVIIGGSSHNSLEEFVHFMRTL